MIKFAIKSGDRWYSQEGYTREIAVADFFDNYSQSVAGVSAGGSSRKSISFPPDTEND